MKRRSFFKVLGLGGAAVAIGVKAKPKPQQWWKYHGSVTHKPLTSIRSSRSM